METVTLQTESFLFQSSDRQFRAIPFYELSIDEWVVFENGQPKYLLDFNRRTKPLVQDLAKRLNSGEGLDESVQKIGRFLGRQWTINHNIEGYEIPDSQQVEEVVLTCLDNLADLFMDIYFLAINKINHEALLNEDKFIENYVIATDEQQFETLYAANHHELLLILAFIFNRSVSLVEILSSGSRQVYDISDISQYCMNSSEFESNYNKWIKNSNRENSMNEYGAMIGVVNFINSNFDKKHLLIITEKRNNW